MNRDFTSNTSKPNKLNTYLSPLVLLILFCAVLLSAILTLLYIVLTTQDKESAVLVLLGCAIGLTGLYGTHKHLKSNDMAQTYIETKSKQAE